LISYLFHLNHLNFLNHYYYFEIFNYALKIGIFKFKVYPNDRHTPNQDTQRIFYKRLTQFLLNCYGIDWKLHLEALNLHHLIEIPG